MKPLPIVITILVLLVVGFLFMRTSTPAPTEEVIVLTPTSTTPITTETLDEEPTDHEGADMSGETGTDINMEYPIADLPADAKIIEISGKNFDYDKAEIRVKEGDTVKINFTSTGGFHDWVVDEFNARTGKVQTDGTTSVTFVADKKGTFEYYCSIGQHRANGMVGKLIVE